MRSVLDDPNAAQLSASSDDFWVIVSALKAFVVRGGVREGEKGDLGSLEAIFVREGGGREAGRGVLEAFVVREE